MVDFCVQQQYFETIKSGVKNIEGRLAKDKYRLLNIGENVTFYNNERTEKIEKKVVSLRIYRTFKDAFRYENYQKAVPKSKSVNDAILVYEQFYSKSLQQQHGVVFIEVE